MRLRVSSHAICSSLCCCFFSMCDFAMLTLLLAFSNTQRCTQSMCPHHEQTHTLTFQTNTVCFYYYLSLLFYTFLSTHCTRCHRRTQTLSKVLHFSNFSDWTTTPILLIPMSSLPDRKMIALKSTQRMMCHRRRGSQINSQVNCISRLASLTGRKTARLVASVRPRACTSAPLRGGAVVVSMIAVVVGGDGSGGGGLWLHFSITILLTSVFHTCRYAACANAFGIEAKDILYCTVNTQQPDMSKLLGSVVLLVYVVVRRFRTYL